MAAATTSQGFFTCFRTQFSWFDHIFTTNSWKIQECLGILVARCASCNCMTYFYCAPLQVYTPFRSAQNHCPPDNVRPAGGYISWGIDSQLIYLSDFLTTFYDSGFRFIPQQVRFPASSF